MRRWTVRDRRRSIPVLAAALLITAVALSGCVREVSVRSTDTLDLELALPAGAPVRVESFNGPIDVTTASGGSASASVTRTGSGADEAKAAADREAIAVTFELADGVGVLRAVYAPDPDSIPGDRSVSVALTVPPGTPLDLATSNGPVTTAGTGGPVSVRTSNGPVDAVQVEGSVRIASSNGPVTITADRPVAADVRTSNGPVTFAGRLAPGDTSFETSSGAVDLRLPGDAAFTLDASTSNGTVTSDLAVAGASTAGTLQGTVGPPAQAESTRVRVRTSNADVTIHAQARPASSGAPAEPG